MGFLPITIAAAGICFVVSKRRRHARKQREQEAQKAAAKAAYDRVIRNMRRLHMRKAAEAKKEADAQLVAETSNEAKRLRAEWFPPQKKSNKSSCSPLCREVLIKLHKNRHKKVLAKGRESDTESDGWEEEDWE